MPDITMCVNRTCSKKDKCKRFAEELEPFQSYNNFNEKDCLYYINKNKPNVFETKQEKLDEVSGKIDRLMEEIKQVLREFVNK